MGIIIFTLESGSENQRQSAVCLPELALFWPHMVEAESQSEELLGRWSQNRGTWMNSTFHKSTKSRVACLQLGWSVS